MLLLALRLGEGGLAVVIGRLSAVRKDYGVASIHKALRGALGLSPNETQPCLQLDRLNNITPHGLRESNKVIHHMGQIERWTQECTEYFL